MKRYLPLCAIFWAGVENDTHYSLLGRIWGVFATVEVGRDYEVLRGKVGELLN